MRKLSAAFFLTLVFTVNVAAGADQSTNASKVTVQSRLGDRFFVRSVLLDVFGAQAKDITYRYIFRPASSFDGPCDPYEQIRIGPEPEDFDDRDSICPGGKFSASLSMIGRPNVLREGYLTRACEALVAKPETLAFALKQVSPAPPPQPNDANVQKAFSLFNPERTAPRAVLDTLEKVASDKTDLNARWSGILLTLCLDPEWQDI